MTGEPETLAPTTPGTRTRSDWLGLLLKMAAPYLAVGIFLIVLHSAWLALLAYHAQILWWSKGSLLRYVRTTPAPMMLLAAPSALAGPALYFLLPYVAHADLGTWLATNGLSGVSLIVMVAYYGLVHPPLEQIHWAPLREATPLAHVAFGAYHMLV